jgi:dihydroflavonol-4-reductase
MNLVLGGTGLVGTHLLLELLKQGEKVKALKRSSSNLIQVLTTFRYYCEDAEELYQQIEWIDGDILDFSSIDAALYGVTKVYHCAAMVSFAPKDKSLMLRNNIEGTMHVVNACLQRREIKLCFVSSIAALGSSESGEEVTEKHMLKPGEKRSTYSISKFKSEMEVWRGIEEGLNAVIINPSVIIGPGDWKKSSASFFPLVKKGLKYYTSGIAGFVDVRDVTGIMIRLMKTSIHGERFIVSAENRSFRDFFSIIAKELHVTAPKFEASTRMLYWVSKMDAIISFLTFSERRLSSDAISAAIARDSYSNKKISGALNYQFKSLEVTISDCAAKFLK